MAGGTPDTTWTALLARWTEFAQSALALPRTGEGRRWKAAVPSIISLQAVTFALAELDRLGASERALGLDRAEIIIDRDERDVLALWRPDDPPRELAAMISDARLALGAARALC